MRKLVTQVQVTLNYEFPKVYSHESCAPFLMTAKGKKMKYWQHCLNQPTYRSPNLGGG